MFSAAIIAIGFTLGIEMVVIIITFYGISFLFPAWANAAHPYDFYPWSGLGQWGISIITLLLLYFFFKIKRLRNGFVFLQEGKGNWIGITICLLIAAWRSFLDDITGFISRLQLSKNMQTAILLFLFLILFLSVIGIQIWWRFFTSSLYRARLAKRKEQETAEEMEQLKQKVQDLSKCNEYLSEIVHRDNKLLPALFHAVADLLSSDLPENAQEQAGSILQQLEDIMKERSTALFTIKKERVSLPATQIDRIDYLLNYMHRKALESGIQFDILIPFAIKEAAEAAISIQMLETLLADLIENSLIATSQSACKKVLLILGVVDGSFEITLQDSGKPFEAETLSVLGEEKSTTYSGQGGSGIGYMSIFSILRQTHASLIISEYKSPKDCFTKSVQICFNHNSVFSVHSYRADVLRNYSHRKDLQIANLQ